MKKILLFIGIATLFSCSVDETESVATLDSLFFEHNENDKDDENSSLNPALFNGIPEVNRKEIYYTDFSVNTNQWDNEQEVVDGKYPLIYTEKKYALHRTVEVAEIGTYDNYEIQFNIELLDLVSDSKLGLIFESMQEHINSSYNFKLNILMLGDLLSSHTSLKLFANDNDVVLKYSDDIGAVFSNKNWSGLLTLRKYKSKIYFFVNDKLVATILLDARNNIEFYGKKFGFYISNLSNTWLLDYRVSLIFADREDN